MEHEPHHSQGSKHRRDADTTADRPARAEQPDTEVEREPQHHPRIYVADLASADRGVRHGLWIDAHQTAAELDADIAAMLGSSPTIGAEAWAIRGTNDFAGLDLTAITDTAVIARLAEGVVTHGAAFAAWVKVTGNRGDHLGQFRDFYVGTYPSVDAWARALAEGLGWHKELDQRITDPLLRPYVVLDYEAIAQDAKASWEVVTDDDGTTHVFVR